MDQLQQQVKIARRRLNWQRFLEVAPWTLFSTLLLALLAVTAPKIWFIPVDPSVWFWSWFGGALAIGLLAALTMSWLNSKSKLDAAVEIDRRFGLKERVSSTLCLSESERETQVGRALTDDAVKRVSKIDVRDKFGVQTSWPVALPILPTAAVLLVMMLGNATPDQTAEGANKLNDQVREQIKKSTEELQKRLEERKDRLTQKGLEDAADLIEQLKQGVEDIANKEDIDRKDAMIKLNDLAKTLEKRREELGGSDEMRKQFKQMGDIENGPADKLNKALKEGDFGKAMQAAEELKQQLESGTLGKEEKEQLAKQLEQLKNRMDQMKEAHEQAKQDLQRQIEQKMAQGDTDSAAKLQQQLMQMQMMDDKVQQMQSMADKLGQAAEQLRNGDQQQAAQDLQDVMDDLQGMQDALDELAAMDDAMEQLGECKNQCNGMGMGMGQQQNEPGMGLGEGQGQGERPLEEDNTGDYASRVRGDVGKGKAVRVGDADGRNVAGRTRQQAQEAVESALNEKSDPLTDQRLPRDQRDHVREYFKRYNGDE